MPTYAYEAMNASGQEVKEEVEATSSEEAIAKIRGKGYFPTKVREKAGKKKVQKKKPGLLKAIIGGVADEVEGGGTLSDAMSKYPKAFDKLYVNMINAGEAGGVLDLILARLADFMEKAAKLKKKVIGAMIYPAVVITIAVGIVTMIMIVVIPKFKEIFESFNLKLPPVTQVLITLSDFMANQYGWAY